MRAPTSAWARRRYKPGSRKLARAEAGTRRFAGPVFANVVLVDEINRASPKTRFSSEICPV